MCRPCSLNDKTFEYDIVGRQINSSRRHFFSNGIFSLKCKNTQPKNTSFKNIIHQKVCHFKIHHFEKLRHLCENLHDS